MKKSRKSERTLNSCMWHGDDHGMGMRRKRKHLEPMCDVQGMSVTKAKQRLTTKTAMQHYAHAHVFSKCFLKSLHTLLGFVLCFVLFLCFVSSMVFLSLWSSTQSVSQILAYFTSRKRVFWGVVFTYKGIIENQEIKKVGLLETHASGNREASAHNDWWEANWWNKYQQERSRRTWSDEVWELFKGSETRWRIEFFFCQDGHGVMNVVFFRQIFEGVPHTCSSDYSMYDSGVYKHSPVARTFFCCTKFVCAHHICTLLRRVHIHAWLKCL